jgi:ribosomal protein S18 acetylase RimI-like enzyme/predicted nucleic acid-binding protein
MILRYRIERDPQKLLERLPSIVALADTEKEALGFLTPPAYRDAILRRRLALMVIQGTPEVVGFVLHGGTFPHARIVQLVVALAHRRHAVASALINDLISRLETRGYLSVSAAVASDLPASQAFYESKSFVARHSRPGGAARGREIVLRVRDLDTPSLFSGDHTVGESDLALRLRVPAALGSLYALDLNVLFDLVRARPREADAARLFGAAFAHQFRLAVASEFVAELERSTHQAANDVILKFAKQLPQLPPAEDATLQKLTGVVHDLVFVETNSPQAHSKQAMSDATHLAHASLAHATGYVTSDGALLSAQVPLLRKIGIDVLSLSEFVDLLPEEIEGKYGRTLKDSSCAVRVATPSDVLDYLKQQDTPAGVIQAFRSCVQSNRVLATSGVREGDEIVAVAASMGPPNILEPLRLLLHVRPDHVLGDLLADHLIDAECTALSAKSPVAIALVDVPGQVGVRRAAALRGFGRYPGFEGLRKVALGRPLTSDNWGQLSTQARRKIGLTIPDLSTSSPTELVALEGALSPTVVLWPGRGGIVVPIAKAFADDLLGTGAQFPLFGSPAAAFLARRTYINSPRALSVMRPNIPILFYESKRTGGRAAVVAAARVVDVVLWQKNKIPKELMRRSVVEVAETLSASAEVIVTSFDGVLRFPNPVSLRTLREIGVTSSSNLQSATELSSPQLARILHEGWLE